MESLLRDFKAIEANYGDEFLDLVISAAFVGKLIGNQTITSFLGQRHPKVLSEFGVIVQAVSLGKSATAA